MTRYNLIPTIFLVSGIIFSVLLSNAVYRSNIEELTLETRITIEQVQLRLSSCINSRIAVVNQLASPKWPDQNALNTNWVAEADSLINLFPGIQALSHINNDGVIDIIYPVAANTPALGANLFEHPIPSVSEALRLASQSSELTRTTFIELLQGDSGFAMYKRIMSTTGQQMGFANGVFRAMDLIETCLPEQEFRSRFNMSLNETDGTVVYQRASSSDEIPWQLREEVSLDVAGRPWLLTLAPTPAFVIAAGQGIETIWFYVGIALVILLAAVMRSLLLQQQSLRESQEKYRLLIENQSDMVVKVNANGEFLYASPSYCTLFGKSEEELLGSAFLPLMHEDDRVTTNESLARLSPDNPNVYHEQRALTKDGWRWLGWSNTGSFDSNNNLESISAVGRDITDIKKLKEDIAHNQKMQAIGEMASGITHDFNNLLQVMMANIEFLIRGSKADEKALGQLQKIQISLERARNLINKLSTLSKQELLIKAVVDLNQYAMDVVEMFKQTLPENMTISLHKSSEDLFIDVDAGQFERVLLNLFINAKEAMQERGSIVITLGKHTLDEEFCKAQSPAMKAGEYARIRVQDSGHGIPQESLSRIFDPFYSTKTRTKSSGLGLANSYSIIKQHDGVIQVESTENIGTTFTMYLPLAKKSEQLTFSQQDTPAEPQTEGKKLILVVDDESELLEITCQMLQANGYQTLSAGNGKEAVDIFANNRDSIALVILDLVMPVMSGQQAAIEIRKLSTSAKILFISGYIPESEGRTIRLNGPLLRKPFPTTALLKKVESLIKPG